jgi:D-lactate dehydrogenase (cytochrome)
VGCHLDSAAVSELRDIVGPAGCLEAPADLARFLAEWRGLYRGSAPLAILPGTTAETAAVIAVCARRGIGVVPQGGNTGLVGGGVPRSTPDRPEIVLSVQRLAAIRDLDPDNYTMTAEAGCVLAALQSAAEEADRFFPLSLAAEGSCQIGGNVSTNAGGINVLRFGTARDLVMGLEVALPDGRIFNGLRALRKDNTGYDLKHLFIGAEGTLGVITAIVCKLFPRPRGIATALVAVADPDNAVALHSRARFALGDELIAFELISRAAMDFVLAQIADARNPLGGSHAWYVLLETASAREQSTAEEELEAFLAECLDSGMVLDGAAARSRTQRDSFWALRHNISEAQKIGGASIKHDISVPVSRMGDFLVEATRLVTTMVPGIRVVPFGHLGDGNLHFNLSQPEDMEPQRFLDLWPTLTREVHAIAAGLGGSFSAEHGIGLLKASELQRLRGGVELDLMRAIKKTLDPAGIMNPGKVLGD